MRRACPVCRLWPTTRVWRWTPSAAPPASIPRATPTRTGQFVCVLAVVRHADDPLPILCEGLWPGRILHAAQGKHGFGYDPLFQPDGEAVSAAELAPAEKNQRSHRARAMAQFKQRLGL